MKILRQTGWFVLGLGVALVVMLGLLGHWLCLIVGQLLRTCGTLLLNLAFILRTGCLSVAEEFNRIFDP